MRLILQSSDYINLQIRKKIKVNSGIVKYHGYTIRFPKNVGMGILSNLYWKGEKGFEEATGRTLIELFKIHRYFFDIGSNFGFYSVLAKKVNPAIQVFAFEPFEAIVTQNLLFKLDNSVDYALIPKGLSDANRLDELFVPLMRDQKKEVTTASFEEDFFFNKKFPLKKFTIECVTLDAFVASQKFEGISSLCIKIDVEGFEVAVLKGALTVFSSIRPIVVCEVANKNLSAVSDILSGLQYEIFLIQTSGLVRLGIDDLSLGFKGHRDFLLCPIEKLRQKNRNFISYTNFVEVFDSTKGGR